MSAESDYISSESKNILRRAKLIKGLLDKDEKRLRQLAQHTPALCQDFLGRIT